MGWSERLVVFICCFRWTWTAEPPCVIELRCAECLPENMPLVTSHRAADGRVRADSGDEVTLSCGEGRLLAYPQLATLTARCEAGRYRAHDGRLRHLLELGCQESVFEDVQHAVEHCAPPLEGRAYQAREAGGARHVAALCYDADRGVAVFARAGALRLPPHNDARAPLTLFGNFNRMFDAHTLRLAERLYSDNARTDTRLREMFKHDDVTFAGQTLIGARLLDDRYFDDRDATAAAFASNAVAVWASVAEGNLRHLHDDVAALLRAAGRDRLQVFAGTHGVAALRVDGERRPLRLAGERFPVPRYVWTVVLDESTRRALAVAVLNEPFVAVSEIREAVFCESACAGAAWLRALLRHRNYETPLYGLAFCCDVHEFARTVGEVPSAALREVPRGAPGMLVDPIV